MAIQLANEPDGQPTRLALTKEHAIEMLGGSVSSAAKAIGIEYQAVRKWPDVLPDRIADRVVAAIARRKYPNDPDLQF